MSKRCLTHIIGPDLSATIRSGIHEIGALPYRQEVRVEADFDFTPVRSLVHGRLLTTSPHSNVVREDREVWIWLEYFSDDERNRLTPGFEFNVLPANSKGSDFTRRVIGVGVVTEVLDPGSCLYFADAEVEIAFEPGFQDAPLGRVYSFHFLSLGRAWKGHLDDCIDLIESSSAPRLGNAYLCLHNVILSQSNPTPGGQPFSELDTFDIRAGDVVIGRGTVARLMAWRERLLRKPFA